MTLTYVSADGEMGFPGNLKTKVTYSLNDNNELRIEYKASTDKPTVLNLTNHSYFNLAGAGNGDVLKKLATLHATHYTPVNGKLIPTGELAPVAGTPIDFTQPTAIGKNIKADHPQLKFAEPKQGGFDFNWALHAKGDVSKLAADVSDPQSGRRLQLYTTEPGVQFYTSNFLDGSVKGKSGKVYPHWGAFTLETQHYPDSPNQPNFPSTRLDPGKVYTQSTVLSSRRSKDLLILTREPAGYSAANRSIHRVMQRRFSCGPSNWPASMYRSSAKARGAWAKTAPDTPKKSRRCARESNWA